MRLLLDTCVCGGARSVLEQAGHDVLWCGAWPEDPGDEEILAFALKEQRVLVTLDKDFGEPAVVQGLRHAGILRLAGFRGKEQGIVCVRILRAYGAPLEAGAIVTVNPHRVRVRSSE